MDPRLLEVTLHVLANLLVRFRLVGETGGEDEGFGKNIAKISRAARQTRFRQGGAARGLSLLLGDDDGRALRDGPAADATLATLVDSARLAERRRALNDLQLEHLRRELPLPQIQLPYLFRTDFGLEAISDLADRLDGQLRNLDDVAWPVSAGGA